MNQSDHTPGETQPPPCPGTQLGPLSRLRGRTPQRTRAESPRPRVAGAHPGARASCSDRSTPSARTARSPPENSVIPGPRAKPSAGTQGPLRAKAPDSARGQVTFRREGPGAGASKRSGWVRGGAGSSVLGQRCRPGHGNRRTKHREPDLGGAGAGGQDISPSGPVCPCVRDD